MSDISANERSKVKGKTVVNKQERVQGAKKVSEKENNSCKIKKNRVERWVEAKRNVAQPGSAHVWGACGRGFKSRHSDHLEKEPPFGWLFL